jgi:hypothetical protein
MIPKEHYHATGFNDNKIAAGMRILMETDPTDRPNSVVLSEFWFNLHGATLGRKTGCKHCTLHIAFECARMRKYSPTQT